MLKPGLVRLLLATLVVLFHITKFVFIGGLAVFCFFILSGYWVTYMYENKYSNIKNSIGVFYLSRIYRLLPVYYLIAIFTFVFIVIFKPIELDKISFFSLEGVVFWLGNIFLIGYNQMIFRPLGPAWSLDIEMQFYLLLPFLFLIMKSKLSRLLCIGFGFLLAVILILFWSETFIGNTILKYLVYFLIGMAIFKSKIKFQKKTEIFFNIFFVLILVSHYCIHDLFSLVKDAHSQYNFFFNFLMSFLLIPFLSNSVLRKSDSIDTIFGSMSYTLYLSHWMFLIPYNYYIKNISEIDRIAYTILYLIITYLFSFLVFKYFDEPLDKLRKNWVGVKAKEKIILLNE